MRVSKWLVVCVGMASCWCSSKTTGQAADGGSSADAGQRDNQVGGAGGGPAGAGGSAGAVGGRNGEPDGSTVAGGGSGGSAAGAASDAADGSRGGAAPGGDSGVAGDGSGGTDGSRGGAAPGGDSGVPGGGSGGTDGGHGGAPPDGGADDTPTEAALHVSWTLRRAEATVTCADIANQNGVSILLTSTDLSLLEQITSCEPGAADVLDLPFGTYTVSVALLDGADLSIASAPDQQVTLSASACDQIIEGDCATNLSVTITVP